MANISKINGFRPVKHLNGSPYNGQANIYTVKSGTKLVPGDLVKLTGGASQNGIAEVDAASNDAAVLGAVVGVVPGGTKLDPVYGKMSTGTISLDNPQTATAGAYVYVADSSDVVYSVEKASNALTDIGLNLDVSGAAGGNSVGVSNQILGTGSTAGNFKVIGFDLTFQPFDPAGPQGSGFGQVAGGDTNGRVLVVPNNHSYQGATAAN